MDTTSMEGIEDDQEAGAPDAGAAPSADARQYATPESLVTMEGAVGDSQALAKLEQNIYDVLVQRIQDISDGRLSRLPTIVLNVPVFNAPPACVQTLTGYQGGEFDPEKRGAAYIVVKKKGVAGVAVTNKREGKWTFNPESSPVSETSQPLMVKVPCSYKKRGKHPAPVMGLYTPYKYYLQDPGFLAEDQPTAVEPSTANLGEESEPVSEANDPSEAGAADQLAVSADDPPAASTLAGTKKELAVYFVMNMRLRKVKTTRVAVPDPATAADDVPMHTPADAPANHPPASEITPDDLSEEVTGLVERLSLLGAATNSDGGTGEGEGGAAASGGAAACAHCGIRGAELKGCLRCLQVAYCGKKCQRAGWKEHKKSCVPLIDQSKEVPRTHEEMVKDWSFWTGKCIGDPRNWTDASLRAVLRSKGRLPPTGDKGATRGVLESATNVLLDELSHAVILVPLVRLAGFDPWQYPDLERDGTVYARGGQAGPLQRAFNVSFTNEQKAQSRVLEGGMPSGMNPDLDARQNVNYIFRAVDRGALWNVFQVADEVTGRHREGLAVKILRVIRIAPSDEGPLEKKQKEMAALQKELAGLLDKEKKSINSQTATLLATRMSMTSETLALVVLYAHSPNNEEMTQARRAEIKRQEPVPVLRTRERVTVREMGVLRRLLEANRAELCPEFVKAAEKGRSWFRVSVLTPFKQAASANKAAKNVLRQDLMCAACFVQKPNLHRCAKCHSTFYCSQECQTGHWEAHKKEGCRRKPPPSEPEGDQGVDGGEGGAGSSGGGEGGGGGMFRSGDKVVIVGLKGATHLNGKFATLLREEPASGRWVLALAEGGKKSVKGENLEQNLARARPNKATSFLPAPEAAAYEAAELFRGVPSFSVPIEEEEAPSDLKTIKMMDCNDEAVKVNTVRSNVHGDKVFVVKAQFIEPLPGRTGQNNVFLYDQLRHNSINVAVTEVGARAQAFKQLAALTRAKGGADRVTPHLTCYKAYLHAQRDGRCLRIFSGRLPAQEQSF